MEDSLVCLVDCNAVSLKPIETLNILSNDEGKGIRGEDKDGLFLFTLLPSDKTDTLNVKNKNKLFKVCYIKIRCIKYRHLSNTDIIIYTEGLLQGCYFCIHS